MVGKEILNDFLQVVSHEPCLLPKEETQCLWLVLIARHWVDSQMTVTFSMSLSRGRESIYKILVHVCVLRPGIYRKLAARTARGWYSLVYRIKFVYIFESFEEKNRASEKRTRVLTEWGRDRDRERERERDELRCEKTGSW